MTSYLLRESKFIPDFLRLEFHTCTTSSNFLRSLREVTQFCEANGWIELITMQSVPGEIPYLSRLSKVSHPHACFLLISILTGPYGIGISVSNTSVTKTYRSTFPTILGIIGQITNPAPVNCPAHPFPR